MNGYRSWLWTQCCAGQSLSADQTSDALLVLLTLSAVLAEALLPLNTHCKIPIARRFPCDTVSATTVSATPTLQQTLPIPEL